MPENLIGPGTPCGECWETYGQHTATCSVPAKKKEERENRLSALGKAFREALETKNDLKLGELLEKQEV